MCISSSNIWTHTCSIIVPTNNAGTLNDINILNLSPLLESFRDGSFESLESEVCPFMIGTSAFQFLYILVDGIYPRWSRFVRGIKEPITRKEKKFTGFQDVDNGLPGLGLENRPRSPKIMR